MSYTTIKAIWPGEKHEDRGELRNAWGGAPLVWNALSARYLGSPHGWLMGNGKNLWALAGQSEIPEFVRRVLMMTFDRAYVLKKDYAKAAADIRKFLEEFPQSNDIVNHWPHIATLFESNPDIPAIGFHHTSVSEDPFRGKFDEETEEYAPTDWSRCWSIYDEKESPDAP
jgi:hypothetical protein